MNLQIKVDPANSNAAIAGVQSGLQKTEDQAKKTQAACDALGGTFKRIADHERFLAAETRKAQQAVDSLGGSFAAIAKHQIGTTLANTAKAFDGLTEAIHREQKMLESIHGPMQKHMQDLQTLDALQRKGAISAEQHANAIARSRSKNGVGNPLDAVSLSAPVTRGRFAGAGSGLGSLPSLAAGGFAAKQVLDLSDGYTNLENRLRQVSSSQAELNSLMEKTRSIADASRSDWGSMGESFVRVTKSTQQLGLSQDAALKLTETMSKAISMSGATSSEAAAGMLQLSQAMSSGVLAGDEFKSVNENLGSVMEALANQLGVPRGALKELAAQGMITTDVIVKAFQSQSAAIDDAFGKTVPTATQQWTLMKNQLTETAGEFVRTSGVMNTLSSVTSSLSTVVNVAGKGIGYLKSATDALGDAFTFIVNPGKLLFDAIGDLAGGDGQMSRLNAAFVESMKTGNELSDAITRMNDGFLVMHSRLDGSVITSVQDFTTKMGALHAQLSKKFNIAGTMGWLLSGGALDDATARIGGLISDPWGGQNPVGKFLDDQKRLNDIMSGNLGKDRFSDLEFINKLQDDGAISTLDYALSMDRLTASTNTHVEAVKKRTENFKEWLDILRTEPQYLDTNAQAWAREKAIREGMVNAMIRDEKKLWDSHNESVEASLDKQLEIAKANEGWVKNSNADAYEEWAKKGMDATTRVNNALNAMNDDAIKNLIESAYSFGDALVDSIGDADFSWRKFMDGMAKDLLKSSLRGLINVGVASLGLPGIGGGRTGFDAMVPAGMGPFLPGFRTGGDMLVGGSGAPDSKIAAFRVSPGETLHVRTPEQRRNAERAASGGQVVNVFVPGSRNGEISRQEINGMVIRVIEQNRGTIGPRLD